MRSTGVSIRIGVGFGLGVFRRRRGFRGLFQFLRSRVFPVNVNNQPVRIRQQESVVLREAVNVENNPRAIPARLSHANLLQKSMIQIEALAHQGRRKLGVVQIKNDACRTAQSLRGKLYFAFKVNRDSSGVWRRPVPDTGNPGRTCWACGYRRDFLARFLWRRISAGNLALGHALTYLLLLLFIFMLREVGAFFGLRPLIQFSNGLARVVGQAMVRVATEEFLKIRSG